ncbi:MAG: hypothetical protein LBR92_04010 [Puniceicoccales bacterium]|jgi:hypothetical protein|nr:hypothetical protein [Puniceicoccales bacterium]
MENCNFIIILGDFQENTLKILHSICDFFELNGDIYTPRPGNQRSQSIDPTENLTIKLFDWDNFIIFFKNESSLERKEVVIMFSPEFNLAEQFQKLFTVRERFPLNIAKIVAIIDYRYFDGHHENLLDAMAYFSDILLIDNHFEIDRDRLKKFLEHCKQKERYPLPIKIIAQYSVKNVSELLDDQPRRMTLIFDDLDPIDFIEEDMVDSAPFTIPTLAQRDKYLKQDDHGRYYSPIELL